ncbi:dihydrodipicolinate synthase family protein, partial [Psychromarinibacter sp. C21-152]
TSPSMRHLLLCRCHLGRKGASNNEGDGPALTIECGVNGINVLGLATEVTKLMPDERRQLVTWLAKDGAGHVPLSVTIAGNSVKEQHDQIAHAEESGVDWLILQPPLVGSYPAATYLEFFARVAEVTDLPVAIQNAPAYLGRGLGDNDILWLAERCPNFGHIKSESSAIETAELVAKSPDNFTVLNGRGGLELIDVLRAGAEGFVVAPDLVDPVVRAYEQWMRGELVAAEATYESALPAIVFVMQSVEHLVTYGKRLMGKRAGIAIHDRAPAVPVTKFGLELVRRYAGGGARDPEVG